MCCIIDNLYGVKFIRIHDAKNTFASIHIHVIFLIPKNLLEPQTHLKSCQT